MTDKIIVTNLYPSHMHFESVRVSLEPAGYRLVSLLRHERAWPDYDGPAAAQFVFNYPMSRELVEVILRRQAAGQPYAVMMDDPLAFFDCNINELIVPILQSAARVFTSTDNMIPIYKSLGVKAELLVGLGNPLFDVVEPVDESAMRYDWGYIGRLYPQRFRFFWQLKHMVSDLPHYIVTKGLDYKGVIKRVRETRVNVAYGNFSDIPDFKSNGTTLRAWEFPYAGAFIIHDPRPLLTEYFKEDESIVTFQTVEECAELIRYYISRPADRLRIARNARAIIDRHRMRDFFPCLYQEIISDGS